jgi:endonuclease/exonuclease/phosphatase (EEP) superfamily protein YafD
MTAHARRVERALRIVCTAVAAIALVACGRAATPRGGASLRVLTYNVWVGNPDLAGTAALLARLDADVVVMQETTPAFADEMRRRLSDQYAYMEFHVGPLGNGPGVLARTPPTNAHYVPSKVGMNGVWVGTFVMAGRAVQIMDVHLHPTLPASTNPVEVANAYQRAEAVRVAQLDELRGALDPSVPAVLVGDFNAVMGSLAMARLRELGWRDGLAGTDAATAPTYQFHGLGFHIDHVLVPAGVACDAPRVVREGTSDHVPVEAVLSWQDR